jgi:hypothetical protein
MDMLAYLKEITHAVGQVIPEIWRERTEISQLTAEVDQLSQQLESEYRQAESIAMNAEDGEDVGLATARHWENYWGLTLLREANLTSRAVGLLKL